VQQIPDAQASGSALQRAGADDYRCDRAGVHSGMGRKQNRNEATDVRCEEVHWVLQEFSAFDPGGRRGNTAEAGLRRGNWFRLGG
jgi:hypothetical protein